MEYPAPLDRAIAALQARFVRGSREVTVCYSKDKEGNTAGRRRTAHRRNLAELIVKV
jgi:hypothetical protein